MNKESFFKVKTTLMWNCDDCKRILTSNEKMYSNGICPWCNAYSGGTIVDCHPVKRTVKYKTFWNWIKGKPDLIDDVKLTPR